MNQQAQAYLNRTPGKGEVGVNLAAIPMAAIERVEVLRDGASSQYGSDAMAGVMNFILRKTLHSQPLMPGQVLLLQAMVSSLTLTTIRLLHLETEVVLTLP